MQPPERAAGDHRPSRRHAAALDFGDLFGYELAKVRVLPLLFKGADFAETDIARVVGDP